MRAVFVIATAVLCSQSNAFEIEMSFSRDANGLPHTSILQSDDSAGEAGHDTTFLTQMRNHMRKAAMASHHAHKSPLQGLFDSIDHIFNDRNEDQSPISALHELSHRTRDTEGHSHQDFVRPHRPHGPGPIVDIQRMIQSMVRPLFEPRELRPVEQGPPRPLVAMACHQDAVQYCRKYCSCWKGMTQCLERNQDKLQPGCKHLLVLKGLIDETVAPEEALLAKEQAMPPKTLQESLRKIHAKVTAEIEATEAAAKADLEEAQESAKSFEEQATQTMEKAETSILHQEKHEEAELEKESELTKGEETPGYLTGEIEKPLGEKDMGGWSMRVYTPEQQARLGLDEEGNTTNDVATQTTTEKDKLIAPKPDIAPTASTWQRFACVFRARLHELHPHALLGAMFGLFLIAFFVGYCRCCRRSDALSRQYTELQAAGSLEQL